MVTKKPPQDRVVELAHQIEEALQGDDSGVALAALIVVSGRVIRHQSDRTTVMDRFIARLSKTVDESGELQTTAVNAHQRYHLEGEGR